MLLGILPFDHRSTFIKELLAFPYPTRTSAQHHKVVKIKQIIFDAFLHARSSVKNPEELAILVDEEFGAPILREAKKCHIPFALAVEKSGQAVFDFEYGKKFSAHITKWKPTHAKALVRYDITQKTDNELQRARLKLLSDFCAKEGIGFMLELLVAGPGTRFAQLYQTMQEIIAEGISPTVWKVEGMATTGQWKKLRALTNAKIIVLGRGDTKTHVIAWLIIAAKSRVVDGFAVGRTVFLKPLMDFRDKKIDRVSTVERIKKNYLYFINLWRTYV